jgi:hypothetical protein
MWVPRVYARVEWHCIRPRFTVRSLMIVVAVAGLILALVAYEQRLTTRARYHQIKYLEYITPVSPQARAQGITGACCSTELGRYRILRRLKRNGMSRRSGSIIIRLSEPTSLS